MITAVLVAVEFEFRGGGVSLVGIGSAVKSAVASGASSAPGSSSGLGANIKQAQHTAIIATINPIIVLRLRVISPPVENFKLTDFVMWFSMFGMFKYFQEAAMNDEKEFFSVKEVADQLNVSDMTVRRWIDSGFLPGAKKGPFRSSHWKIPQSALDHLKTLVREATANPS